MTLCARSTRGMHPRISCAARRPETTTNSNAIRAVRDAEPRDLLPCLLPALVRTEAGIAASSKVGTPVYPASYSVNRYFSSTHSATTPSRQVIFLPSS